MNPDKALLHLAGATGAALVYGFSVLRYIVRRGR